MNTSPFSIPSTIGDYRIIRKLGEGGIGRVYEGMHPNSADIHLAIKVVRNGVEDLLGKTAAEILGNELVIHRTLRHSGIVRVEKVVTDHDQPHLVMELVQGKNLTQLIEEQGGKLSPDQAEEIFLKILEPIASAHMKKILHRDLKPSNILIDNEGNVKITDFGIGKMIGIDQSDASWATSRVLGSPFYMSPEQVEGKPVDERTDIFSLGRILGEMLGKKPHHSSPNLPAGTPKHLEEIWRRCLEDESARRFPNLEKIREALLSQKKSGTKFSVLKHFNRSRFADGVSVIAALITLYNPATAIGAIVGSFGRLFEQFAKETTPETSAAISQESVDNLTLLIQNISDDIQDLKAQSSYEVIDEPDEHHQDQLINKPPSIGTAVHIREETPQLEHDRAKLIELLQQLHRQANLLRTVFEDLISLKHQINNALASLKIQEILSPGLRDMLDLQERVASLMQRAEKCGSDFGVITHQETIDHRLREQQAQEMQIELEALAREVQNATKYFQEIENSLIKSRAEASRELMTDHIPSVSSEQASFEEYRQSFEGYRDQFVDWAAQESLRIADLSAELDAQKEQFFHQMQRERAEIERLRSDGESDRLEAEIVLSEIQKARDEITEIRSQNIELEQQKEAVIKAISMAESRLRTLEAHVSTAQDKKSKLDSQLTSTNDQFNNTVRQFEEKKEALARVESSLTSLKQEFEELQGRKSELSRQIIEQEQILEAARTEYKNLTQQVLPLKQGHAPLPEPPKPILTPREQAIADLLRKLSPQQLQAVKEATIQRALKVIAQGENPSPLPNVSINIYNHSPGGSSSVSLQPPPSAPDSSGKIPGTETSG